MTSFTRRAIIASFMKLIEERPLSKISIRDIVEDCGVNRNTFYYHFADLPALVETVVRSDIDKIIEDNASVASTNECLNILVNFMLSRRRIVLHLYNSSTRDIVERHLMDVAKYTVRTYLDTAFPDIDILESDREIIVRASACELYGMMAEWMNQSLRDDWRDSFLRYCELRAGSIEMMLRRSAQDKKRICAGDEA